MSPSPAAPSSASITACATTSASECPARPGSPGISTPAEHEPAARLREAVGVVADAGAALAAHPSGSSRRSRRSNTHDPVDAARRAAARPPRRSRGRSSPARARPRRARPACRPRRTSRAARGRDRSPRPACAGRRSRPRSPRPRRRSLASRSRSRRAAGAAGRAAPAPRPSRDRDARARRTGRSRRPRRAPRSTRLHTSSGSDGLPDVVAVVVHGAVGDEVHRADYVVPRPAFDQARRSPPRGPGSSRPRGRPHAWHRCPSGPGTRRTRRASPSAHSSQKGCRQMSSASRKRYTCSEKPSSAIPRAAAASR